ncbi:MAG: SDR family NAD(P)-dependent oxidoreductase [Pseudomonadales bacterium]|nr:SDR family NAD(P)-dependent oxidoreductase [Pseudomonadales bacterium]
MDTLEGTVAVVTGGAGGIGFALACAAQAKGAKVVIADLRAEALEQAVERLATRGEVLGVQVDVASATDVERLAQETFQRFGKVNLLFNNAGVFASGLTWETSEAEYDWVIGVNQRSVIHGIRSFVPHMIAQRDPCHVVTIASGAGITVNPGFCTYSMTKHAVVALTEALYLDLATEGIDNIGVTIVMPGMSRSDIMNPEKTGPAALREALDARLQNRNLRAIEEMMRSGVKEGLPAEDLAAMVLDAVSAGKLYVLPAFTDEGSQAIAQAVGIGRATGNNPYPQILAGLHARLQDQPA